MCTHRAVCWTVLCTVLTLNMAQEVPSIEEVEDAEVSHTRSPLALALDKVAPPKGLAVALTKSLLEDQDDLQESAQVEHYWIDNEAYLGRTQLRHKLIQAVRAVTPPSRPKRVISRHSARSESVQTLDVEMAQQLDLPDPELHMEGDLARVISNYYGPQLKSEESQTEQITGSHSHPTGDELHAGDAFGSNMDVFLDMSSEWAGTHELDNDELDDSPHLHLLEETRAAISRAITPDAVGSAVTTEDVVHNKAPEDQDLRALKDAAKEALRVAYMTGNAQDLEKANTALEAATKAAERAQTAQRNVQAIQAEHSGNHAQLATLVERRNLQRRVEGRLEAEHVISLQADARMAKKKAHTAQLKAAHELQHWVENRPGADRRSVDKTDGLAEFATQNANEKEAAAKIASQEAARNPLFGDSNAEAPVNGTEQAGDGRSDVSHEVAKQQSDAARKRAQDNLKWALDTDHGFKKAEAAVAIAEEYSDVAKNIRKHKIKDAREAADKAKKAAEIALDEAVVSGTPAKLKSMKKAMAAYRSLDRKAERMEDEKEQADALEENGAEKDPIQALSAKDKADTLEAQAISLARKAYQRAAASGVELDLQVGHELGEQVSQRELDVEKANRALWEEKIAMATQAARIAEKAANTATIRSVGMKRDLARARRLFKAAKRQKRDLKIQAVRLKPKIAGLRDQFMGLAEDKHGLSKEIAQLQEQGFRKDVARSVNTKRLNKIKQDVAAAKLKQRNLEKKISAEADEAMKVVIKGSVRPEEAEAATQALTKVKVLKAEKFEHEMRQLAQNSAKRLDQYKKKVNRIRDAEIDALEAAQQSGSQNKLKIANVTATYQKMVNKESVKLDQELQNQKKELESKEKTKPQDEETAKLERFLQSIQLAKKRQGSGMSKQDEEGVKIAAHLANKAIHGPSYDRLVSLKKAQEQQKDDAFQTRVVQKIHAQTVVGKEIAQERAERATIVNAKNAMQQAEQAQKDDDPKAEEKLQAARALQKKAAELKQAQQEKGAKAKETHQKKETLQKRNKAMAKAPEESVTIRALQAESDATAKVLDQSLRSTRNIEVTNKQLEIKVQENIDQETSQMEELTRKRALLQSKVKTAEVNSDDIKRELERAKEQLTRVLEHQGGMDLIIKTAKEHVDDEEIHYSRAKRKAKQLIARLVAARKDLKQVYHDSLSQNTQASNVMPV